jgi:hypothetical protein
MRKARLFAITGALGALLALPSASHGIVTIGSDLGDANSIGIGCLGGSCTRVQTSLPADDQMPGGVASTVNGTVVRWRVKHIASATQFPIAFRVISPAAGGQFTGGGTSATVTPPDVDGITTFVSSIPIKVGDLYGLNYGAGNHEYFGISAGPNSGQLFNPILGQGSTRSPDSNTSEQLLVNAEIEPTSTLTSVKKKAKRGGKVKLTIEVPNAGTLVAGDKKDKGVTAVAAAKKPTLVKNKRMQLSAPGKISLLLKPTKAAKAALAAGRKPKAKLKIVFTPTGGSPSSKLLQIKLKP